MAKKFIKGTELVQAGYANGISIQLARAIEKDGPNARLSDAERSYIIQEAAKHFGGFLEAKIFKNRIQNRKDFR